MSAPRLILASASPRRRELLGLLGIPFEILPADVDETVVDGEPPESTALRLAQAKARRLAEKHPGSLVLGADTVVAVEHADGFELLAKPEDEDDARRMLRALSGRQHLVVTGFHLEMREPKISHSQAVTTTVTFRPLGEDEIDAYVATGEPFDKAGGYGIQGVGGIFIERIEGSASNVIGLPICEVALALRATKLFSLLALKKGL